ncbi:MAG: helix-turn-helix domain-containing protein [Lachnospiraceae bacterium]|nr:helix-turn-helix domain-containing protein [Lachnospiraceae bacterium]
MISDQVIAKCIEDAGRIGSAEMIVTDPLGKEITRTSSAKLPEKDDILRFANGNEDESETDGQLFIRICDENETAYILISSPGEGGYVSARLAASHLTDLIAAYKDKVDRNSFFQDILLDNLLLVDIYNRAKKLHIEAAQKRCVYVIEPVGGRDNGLIDMIRELFYTEAGDYVTAVDEDRVVVIRALFDDDNKDDLAETASMLVDMAGSEAMKDVRVAYGSVADDIKGVSKSYKEARMALDVGKIFYPLKRTMEYGNLGVGRLIYQLPVGLCRLFVKEIFGEDIPEEIDEEVLTTVNKFFENSLNVSETSRQLFIHRNTLIYRIEKLQKATGLDVRVFDDALTLKIALMVVNYMKYADDGND